MTRTNEVGRRVWRWRLAGRGALTGGWIGLALALALPVAAPGIEADETQKQVLVLYAVRRDAQIAVVGDRELPRIIQGGLPEGVDYYSEFIDVARVAQTDYQRTFREFLAMKYQEHRFDVVIAIGEVPIAFLDRHRGTLFPHVPVVFFSSRATPLRLPNSTGLTAEVELTRTLDLALALQPDLQHVFVVSGAAKTEFEQTARVQFAPYEARLDVTYLAGLPSSELEARLVALPARSAVIYLVVDRDANNRNFHPLEYLDRVTSLANAPVYSWVDSALDHGIVGGSLKDQTREVEAVGALALRVLRGEAADAIPVSAVHLNTDEIDWRQLKRWGLSEARIPAGTIVNFREPSVWDRYKLYIIAALSILVAQSILIGGLLVQRARRRVAERQVRLGQDALGASFERIRDLGGRLLHAQDSERARIARELHDDVSQQMALLEIDLELLGRTLDDPSATADALGRARSVARSVHDLSHRLHPAKLRLIGLTAALKGLQRELSQAGVPIAFTSEDVPATLPPDVTLCLFRVAQEALQNAVKHSGARNIAMHVRGSPEHVALAIVDDGAGFDVKRAWGDGLGLLSMKERVEAAGGRFELHTAPETGTRISVTVPLRAESA